MRMRANAAVKRATRTWVRRAQFVGRGGIVRAAGVTSVPLRRTWVHHARGGRPGPMHFARCVGRLNGIDSPSSISRHTALWDGRPKRLLHVAPKRQLSALLASVPDVTYVSMDLMSKRAMVRPEITRLSFPNRSFDVIYCSHVLEHVPDDTAAMRELRRVLRPSGWAILQAPVLREVT